MKNYSLKKMGTAAVAALVLATGAVRAEVKTDIVYKEVEGEKLLLDASVPDGTGPFPAAIIVHGGGFVGGEKQMFVKPLFQPLSDAGYVWFTINYRLSPQHPYPAAVEDVESAIRWVKAHAREYKVDASRIALMGESAGGVLVSYVGAQNHRDTRVAAVVPIYGAHDLEVLCRARGELHQSMQAYLQIPELNAWAYRQLRKASPVTYVKKGLPPFLLIHGTKDKQVPYEQSILMQQALRDAGNRCDLITVPDGEHGMGTWEHDPAWKAKMLEWLHENLENRPARKS